MQNEINTLIETIKADYTFFMKRGNKDYDLAPHQVEMINEFNTELQLNKVASTLKLPQIKAYGALLLTLIKTKSLLKVISLKQQDTMLLLATPAVAIL